MSRSIVLDSFPTSSTSKTVPQSGPVVLSEQCHQWILDCQAAGNQIVIPSICYYESLRELERLRATTQIRRLQDFCFASANRFISITDAHLEAAAKMWGQVRNAGLPTASKDALDADVILAAQALSLGLPPSDFVIATTNVGHLSRFVPAEDWIAIAPGS